MLDLSKLNDFLSLLGGKFMDQSIATSTLKPPTRRRSLWLRFLAPTLCPLPSTFFQFLHRYQSLTNEFNRHVMMSILLLVRNFVPAHEQIQADDWNVAQVARNAFDLEGKVVGTVGCGRIGYRVLQRLQPFQCKELLWFDYADLPAGKFKPMLP